MSLPHLATAEATEDMKRTEKQTGIYTDAENIALSKAGMNVELHKPEQKHTGADCIKHKLTLLYTLSLLCSLFTTDVTKQL